MPRTVLALNCGSSSLKFGAYQMTDQADPELIAEGEAEEIGRGGRFKDHVEALSYALDSLREQGVNQLQGVGHRFVHGGPHLREHSRIDGTVLQELTNAIEYAPLHLPTALSVLKAMQNSDSSLPQVACLDTTFHRHMLDVSKILPLPAEVRKSGVERYGFHGLSLESILMQLSPVPERLVVAHLGNGSSITAILAGASIDTSMGLTPTGGVMMGTRCGDLDPGALVFLLRHGYADPHALEHLCDHESGLLGVSGIASDVRELIKLRPTEQSADLALRMFSYQVRKAIAGMGAALGGIDLLVFTGGIGEHAAELRNEICQGLAVLGKFEVRVLPALENLQIARNTARLL